ncbi:DUF1127 domain-containing protein [Hoeflea alexandrii]
MKLIQSYASWRKYRETCVELNRLSERELSDIGMTRGDIPFAARRACNRFRNSERHPPPPNSRFDVTGVHPPPERQSPKMTPTGSSSPGGRYFLPALHHPHTRDHQPGSALLRVGAFARSGTDCAP